MNGDDNETDNNTFIESSKKSDDQESIKKQDSENEEEKEEENEEELEKDNLEEDVFINEFESDLPLPDSLNDDVTLKDITDDIQNDDENIDGEANEREMDNIEDMESKEMEFENGDDTEEKYERELEEKMWQMEMNHFYLPGDFPELPENFQQDSFPRSYWENSVREDACLQLVDNFRRQFRLLYGDRKPLFMSPENEVGQRKLVCTYLTTASPPFPALHYWEGAAKFTAAAVTPVPLRPVTQTPTRLLASSTALELGLGTCFEAASLLTCLLLGAGYNAFVVNGYATREICFWDQTRQDCPLDDQSVELDAKQATHARKKYAVRPPKDLQSKFELEQVNRKIREEETRIEKVREDRIKEELESEKPRKDPLFGQRVHSWVLVLAGKREIGESFFIEPFTGEAKSIDCCDYLGIESIWNDKNYFVNMQTIMNGVGHLNYDLNNNSLWEYLLPGQEPVTITPPYENVQQNSMLDDDEGDKNDAKEKYFDLPKSWIKPISITLKQFEQGGQNCKREVVYRKSRVELQAPYISSDGMTNKIKKYEDKDLKRLEKITEVYKNRKDHLIKRVVDPNTDMVWEYFNRGRKSHLKEYNCCNDQINDSKKTFKFYFKSRVDHLTEIKDFQRTLESTYENRDDFLLKRVVKFGKREKKFGPANEREYQKPFETITEYYDRNVNIDAHRDIQEITYHILEDRIQIYFHPDKNNIAGDMIDFIKSHANSDARRGSTVLLARDSSSYFQVDPYREGMSEVETYQYFKFVLEKEEACKNNIRSEENEIREILKLRDEEMIANNLEISLFDRVRNDTARNTRIELERAIEEDKNRVQDEELDYLEPFLLQLDISNDDEITKEKAMKLYQKCMDDFHERATNKANLLQARFEQETKKLQEKENWYHLNQNIMKKNEEDEYIQKTKELSFRITTLEKMVARHKQTNRFKEVQLETKLKEDKRLFKKFDR